ncbi:hypothetical protein ANTPLA_LOCUS10248 [Anthophora plagiata]
MTSLLNHDRSVNTERNRKVGKILREDWHPMARIHGPVRSANTKAQAWHEINVGCWSTTTTNRLARSI